MVHTSPWRSAPLSIVLVALSLTLTGGRLQENQMNARDMPLKWTEYSDIATLIERLPAWGDRDFTAEEWQQYLVLADALQALDDESMERILLIYLDRAWQTHKRRCQTEAYTQPMILVRLMFSTSAELFDGQGQDGVRGSLQGRGVSIMGSGMWYKPFDAGVDRMKVAVTYPVVLDEHGPRLIGAVQSGFPGSTPSRPEYQMHLEHRAFRELYQHRDLAPFVKDRRTWRQLVAIGADEPVNGAGQH